MKGAQIVLSIETGVRGGSLSLLKNRSEIDGWIGEDKVSKAEDVLEQTADLLKRNNIDRRDINLITISQGPGSATGLRIGEALALGLRKSTGCDLKSVPLLEAMAERRERFDNSASAIPFGKNQIYWQIHSKENTKNRSVGELCLSARENFLSEIKNKRIIFLTLHQPLYDDLQVFFNDASFSNIKIKPVSNLAQKIGLFGYLLLSYARQCV